MTSPLDNLARQGQAAIEGAAEAGARYLKEHGGAGDLSGGGRRERFVLDLRTNRDPDPDPKAITPDPKVITPAPDPEPQPQPLVEPSPLVQAADAALEPAVQEPQPLVFDPLKGAISPDHAPLVVQTDAVIVDPSAPLPGASAPTVGLDVLELTGLREDPGFFANGINGLANGINRLFGLPPASLENTARSVTNFTLQQRGIPLHIGHDGIVHLTNDAAGGSMLAPLLMELNRPGSLDPAGYSALPNLPSRDLLASAGFSEDFISGFEASVDNIRGDAAAAAAVGIGTSMIGAATQIGSGSIPHLQGEGTVYTGARQGQLPGTAEGRPQIELRFNPATGTFERVVVPPQPGGVVTQPGSAVVPSQFGPGSIVPQANGIFLYLPGTSLYHQAGHMLPPGEDGGALATQQPGGPIVPGGQAGAPMPQGLSPQAVQAAQAFQLRLQQQDIGAGLGPWTPGQGFEHMLNPDGSINPEALHLDGVFRQYVSGLQQINAPELSMEYVPPDFVSPEAAALAEQFQNNPEIREFFDDPQGYISRLAGEYSPHPSNEWMERVMNGGSIWDDRQMPLETQAEFLARTGQANRSARDALIFSIQQQDPAAAQRLNEQLQALRPRDNAPRVDQRINSNLPLLLNPQQFLQNNPTVTNSPLMQLIRDRYAGDIQTAEDVARMATNVFIDKNTGLMAGNAIPLFLNNTGDEGISRVEYLEFSGMKPTNTIAGHELGDNLIALGAEVIRRELTEFAPEHFGQDLNLFYAGGTGFFITGPDSLVPDAIRHLREAFHNVHFGTAETPEPSVYPPRLVFETVGRFGLIAHEPGFGDLLNDLYALARGRIDQTKLDDPDYPNRMDPLYVSPENPEALTDVRIIEGSQVVAEHQGRTRSPATERLREAFPGLVEQIAALSPEEFALYRDQVLASTYVHRVYGELGNNRMALEAIRDENGVVLSDQSTTILDISRLGGLNNLPIVSNPAEGINTWEAGNRALAAYQQYLAEAAIIWPDLIVTQPGFGDEAAILGPSEDVQAAMTYIRGRLAETVITIPDPRDPTRSVSVHGLGVQFGYGEIAGDGTMPDPQLLEERAAVDKAEQGYGLHVTDQDDNLIFSERSPE